MEIIEHKKIEELSDLELDELINSLKKEIDELNRKTPDFLFNDSFDFSTSFMNQFDNILNSNSLGFKKAYLRQLEQLRDNKRQHR